MLDKKERLMEMYEYARRHLGVHTQIDFASVVGCSRAVMSSALNGNKQYLTDSLFQKVCAAFPGVFNADYALTGEGSLLAEQKPEPAPVIPPTAMDFSILIEKAVDKATAYQEKLIARLDADLDDAHKHLEELRYQIEQLKRENEMLRTHNDVRYMEDYAAKNPKPQAVAESEFLPQPDPK